MDRYPCFLDADALDVNKHSNKQAIVRIVLVFMLVTNFILFNLLLIIVNGKNSFKRHFFQATKEVVISSVKTHSIIFTKKHTES